MSNLWKKIRQRGQPNEGGDQRVEPLQASEFLAPIDNGQLMLLRTKGKERIGKLMKNFSKKSAAFVTADKSKWDARKLRLKTDDMRASRVHIETQFNLELLKSEFLRKLEGDKHVIVHGDNYQAFTSKLREGDVKFPQRRTKRDKIASQNISLGSSSGSSNTASGGSSGGGGAPVKRPSGAKPPAKAAPRAAGAAAATGAAAGRAGAVAEERSADVGGVTDEVEDEEALEAENEMLCAEDFQDEMSNDPSLMMQRPKQYTCDPYAPLDDLRARDGFSRRQILANTIFTYLQTQSADDPMSMGVTQMSMRSGRSEGPSTGEQRRPAHVSFNDTIKLNTYKVRDKTAKIDPAVDKKLTEA